MKFSVLQGTLNGPPPEFLQSLVQMAGQIMNRITTTDTSTNTTSTTQSSSSSANETTSSQPQSGSGQTSQARGNTTTNPTTATHTRSTARPHVHLAQQAMQGGFDPFLPCNSHHIMHRRRNGQQGNARPTQQQPAGQSRDGEAGEGGESRTTERQPPNLHNLFDELYSSLRTAYRRREGARPNGQTPTTGASVERERRTENEEASGSTANATGQIPPGLANLIPNLQSTLVSPLLLFFFSFYFLIFTKLKFLFFFYFLIVCFFFFFLVCRHLYLSFSFSISLFINLILSFLVISTPPSCLFYTVLISTKVHIFFLSSGPIFM